MLIAEFVKVSGLGRDTVRFYIRKGLLTPEIGRSGTNRYQSFDDEQVERALLIREAQSLGFTLREISVLGEEYARGMTLERQAQLMRERLAAIDEQAAKLKRLRRYFASKVAWLEGGALGVPPAFSIRRRQNGSGIDAGGDGIVEETGLPASSTPGRAAARDVNRRSKAASRLG